MMITVDAFLNSGIESTNINAHKNSGAIIAPRIKDRVIVFLFNILKFIPRYIYTPCQPEFVIPTDAL